MTRGPLFRAAIPGEWADGWLYKDHLFLWTADGELLQAPLARFVAELRGAHNDEIALAAQLALFRNDWKGGLQTSALARPARIRDALREVADTAGRTSLVELSTNSFEEVEIEPIPGFVLSVSIYGNHAFIASSEGLFEANLNPEYLDEEHDLVSRLEVPVHDIETNFGAVAASAFEGGLWFDQINFGDSGSWDSGGPMQRLADFSSGVSMASRDLLNFTDGGIPELYLAKSERGYQSARSRYESVMVTAYERADDDLVELSARSLGIDRTRVSAGGVRLLANSKQRLLYDVDGRLQLLQLRTLNGVRLDSAGELGSSLEDVTGGGPAVSSHALGDGFLVEGFERVAWVGDEGVTEVSARSAVTVRTFPSSKHFIETALIVEEDRAILVGFLDFPRT